VIKLTDIKLSKYYTPYLYWKFDASIQNKGDGKSYLRWKDERGATREMLITPGVIPVTEHRKKSLGREENESVYLMNGDNFVSVTDDTFKIQGKHTNEEIVMSQAIAHGATKGLYDAIATKDKYKNLMMIAAVIVIVLIMLGGMYLLFTNAGSLLSSVGIGGLGI